MKKLTIEHAKEIAVKNNGLCLSDDYIGSSSPLWWKCGSCQYEWITSYNCIKRGQWCPKCGGTLKLTQAIVEETIISKGGLCLSQYVNNRSKLNIKCFYGHIFNMSWNKIQSGQWCPLCSKSVSERICRECFEQIFGLKFPSVRPSWLMGDKNRPLELDGYCEDLNLAFEHNGSQHYKKLSRMSIDEFNRIVKNDATKIELCKKMGVKLIIIPELFSKTKLHNLKSYILKECIEQRVSLPHNVDEININFDRAYFARNVIKKGDNFIPTNNKYVLQDMIDISIARGGKCLSEYYDNNGMIFRCANNHIWTTTPHSVRSGCWCKACYLGTSGKAIFQHKLEA